jgi:sporulation protein YlmC with PRC-barrel domain
MEPTKPNSTSTPFGSRTAEQNQAGDSSHESNAGLTAGSFQTASQDQTSGQDWRAGSSASASGSSSVGTGGQSTPPQSFGSVSDRDPIVGGGNAYWDNDGPGPRIMAADTLEGDKVVNAAGEDLGEITDIMIDVPSGRVAYAVLSFGGFLGMGDKLFAIPWQALQLDPENKCFILDVDRERLRSAPGFDKDHWPSMADQRWATDIHSYYGSRPYWE